MKTQELRWTANKAADEFGLDRKTIAQRIKTAGTVPGADGKFSTKEIHGAICRDIDKERLRKLKEDADQVALANAKEREELVDKQDFVGRLERFVVEAKQKIMASDRPDADKDALLNFLADLLKTAYE